MKCSICGKEYQTYPETKNCYDSHQNSEPIETSEASPLDLLKQLLYKRSEPIKHIGPKIAAKEGEESPKTVAERIIGMAKDKDFKGVGKVTLSEIRFELADESLLLKDILDLLHEYAPNYRAEPHPGRMIYIYFNTKPSIKKVYDPAPSYPQLQQAVRNVTKEE